MRIYVVFITGFLLTACDSGDSPAPTVQKSHHLKLSVEVDPSGASDIAISLDGAETEWSPGIPLQEIPSSHAYYFPTEFCAAYGANSQIIYPANTDHFYSLQPDAPDLDPGYSHVVRRLDYDGLMYLYSSDNLYKAVDWSSEEMSFSYRSSSYFGDAAPLYGPMSLQFDSPELQVLSSVEFPAFAPVNLIYPMDDAEFLATDSILWEPFAAPGPKTYIDLELESFTVREADGLSVISYLTCTVEDDGEFQLPKEAIDYLGADNPIKVSAVGRNGNIDIEFGYDLFTIFSRTSRVIGATWPCPESSPLCN